MPTVRAAASVPLSRYITQLTAPVPACASALTPVSRKPAVADANTFKAKYEECQAEQKGGDSAAAEEEESDDDDL
jgi:hypothetical protein